MDLNNITRASRIGINYYSDTLHYREEDAQKWVPIIKDLGFSWVVLMTPENRAIPENFLKGLINSEITPILHFSSTSMPLQKNNSFELLINNYAKWGVKYICLYNTPNIKQNWKPNNWLQNRIIDFFLDCYLPYADTIVKHNMVPIFPPLQPGGDFWDLTFLRLAIKSIQRRGHIALLENMAVGINAFTYNRKLDWGRGGQEIWPESRPYFTPPGSEDHFGFHIFDWYSEIIISETGKNLPIIIMRTNSIDGTKNPDDCLDINPEFHEQECIAIRSRMLSSLEIPETKKTGDVNGIKNQQNLFGKLVPDHVISCNYWLLSCRTDDVHTKYAWFKPDGKVMPVVNSFKKITMSIKRDQNQVPKNLISFAHYDNLFDSRNRKKIKNIRHYLLLGSYPTGLKQEDLSKIIPFVERYNPTLGFSLGEALKSSRVTLIGDKSKYPEETINKLHMAGCKIEFLTPDGILLAI